MAEPNSQMNITPYLPNQSPENASRPSQSPAYHAIDNLMSGSYLSPRYIQQSPSQMRLQSYNPAAAIANYNHKSNTLTSQISGQGGYLNGDGHPVISGGSYNNYGQDCYSSPFATQQRATLRQQQAQIEQSRRMMGFLQETPTYPTIPPDQYGQQDWNYQYNQMQAQPSRSNNQSDSMANAYGFGQNHSCIDPSSRSAALPNVFSNNIQPLFANTMDPNVPSNLNRMYGAMPGGMFASNPTMAAQQRQNPMIAWPSHGNTPLMHGSGHNYPTNNYMTDMNIQQHLPYDVNSPTMFNEQQFSIDDIKQEYYDSLNPTNYTGSMLNQSVPQNLDHTGFAIAQQNLHGNNHGNNSFGALTQLRSNAPFQSQQIGHPNIMVGGAATEFGGQTPKVFHRNMDAMNIRQAEQPRSTMHQAVRKRKPEEMTAPNMSNQESQKKLKRFEEILQENWQHAFNYPYEAVNDQQSATTPANTHTTPPLHISPTKQTGNKFARKQSASKPRQAWDARFKSGIAKDVGPQTKPATKMQAQPTSKKNARSPERGSPAVQSVVQKPTNSKKRKHDGLVPLANTNEPSAKKACPPYANTTSHRVYHELKGNRPSNNMTVGIDLERLKAMQPNLANAAYMQAAIKNTTATTEQVISSAVDKTLLQSAEPEAAVDGLKTVSDGYQTPALNPTQAGYNPYLVQSSELNNKEGRREALMRVMSAAFTDNPTIKPSDTYKPSKLNEPAKLPQRLPSPPPTAQITPAKPAPSIGQMTPPNTNSPAVVEEKLDACEVVDDGLDDLFEDSEGEIPTFDEAWGNVASNTE